MRRFLQRTASWTCALLVLLAHGTLGATTRIVPLVDRPGACSYCASVKEALEAARESVDLLLSDAELDGNPLLSWVVSVVERGVRVRAILDSSDWSLTITEKNRPTVDYLRERGVDARFDDPAVTTHAKLVVVDRRVVILGSTNWNRHAVSEQEQANVLVEDERIGGVFAEYFERLWNETLPEAGVALDLEPLSAREPSLIAIPEVAGTTNYVRVLTQLLASAQRSVHVVMYRASHYPAEQELNTPSRCAESLSETCPDQSPMAQTGLRSGTVTGGALVGDAAGSRRAAPTPRAEEADCSPQDTPSSDHAKGEEEALQAISECPLPISDPGTRLGLP